MGYTTMRDGANHNAEPGGSEFKLGWKHKVTVYG